MKEQTLKRNGYSAVQKQQIFLFPGRAMLAFWGGTRKTKRLVERISRGHRFAASGHSRGPKHHRVGLPPLIYHRELLLFCFYLPKRNRPFNEKTPPLMITMGTNKQKGEL